MKKSLLTLLVASTLIITGCEDKETSQKLQNAEQKIVQLENDLKTAQAQFPALQVEITEFFNKTEEVKFEKDPNEEFDRESGSVSLFVSLPKTQVEWLNQLLLKQAFELSLQEGEQQPTNLNEQTFTELLKTHYDAMINEAKEDKPIGLDSSINSFYLGQRNHIASFKMLSSSYYGGAHGMYFTRYLNIDTQTKTLIKLDDLINKANRPKVKEMLWLNYQHQRLNEEGKYEGYANEKEFRISEEFYFDEAGIHFVYPPYELGGYAEGEVEVLLGWYEANNFLNPTYMRTKKDGFYDDEPME